PHRSHARSFVKRCLPHRELPLLGPMLIAGSRNPRAHRRNILIKQFQHMLPRLRHRRLGRKLASRTFGEIQPILFHHAHSHPRQLRNVSRQPPQQHRLLMGLPGQLVLRNPLQSPPRRRHLRIKLRQQLCTNPHRTLLKILITPRSYPNRVGAAAFARPASEASGPPPHTPLWMVPASSPLLKNLSGRSFLRTKSPLIWLRDSNQQPTTPQNAQQTPLLPIRFVPNSHMRGAKKFHFVRSTPWTSERVSPAGPKLSHQLTTQIRSIRITLCSPVTPVFKVLCCPKTRKGRPQSRPFWVLGTRY